jgi:hypothetical protein
MEEKLTLALVRYRAYDIEVIDRMRGTSVTRSPERLHRKPGSLGSRRTTRRLAVNERRA